MLIRLGNFSAPFGDEFELVRGSCYAAGFFYEQNNCLQRRDPFQLVNAAADGYTITYDWGDGTTPAVIQPGL
jgi:hypothetical protein